MNNYYHQGCRARTQSLAKTSCPYRLHGFAWAWWVAGWNDTDREDLK